MTGFEVFGKTPNLRLEKPEESLPQDPVKPVPAWALRRAWKVPFIIPYKHGPWKADQAWLQEPGLLSGGSLL